jgi:hypothetical protein
MPSNITLDQRLIEEARKVGGHRANQGAVTAALKEYIRYRKQLAILDLTGKTDFDPGYDYKAERRGKR